MQQHDWLNEFPVVPSAPRGAPQPLIPREAAPQTPGQIEHQNLSNTALRLQNEAAQQHLDPATIDMLAHQYILAGPPALQGVGGMGRTAAANRMAILNRAAEIAGARPGENVQVGFSRYRNGVHALQNLENQLGTISTNEQTALSNGEQMLARIREVYPPNSTAIGNIGRGIYRDFFNDPAMAAYDAARNTFLTEYAKVVAGSPSGSGVLSDSARREQQDNLRRATSPEAAEAALNQMRRDMANRIQAFQGNIRRGYTNLEAGVPIAFQPNGDLVDERGAVIAPEARNRSAPPTVFGTPSGAPPSGGSPPSAGPPPGAPPIVPHGSSPVTSVSSDTPPAQEVTPDYLRQTQEVQALFDGGATREQLDAFNVRHGRPPFGPLLDQAIQYRDNGGRGARILPPEATTAAGAEAGHVNDLVGQLGTSDLFMHGASLGLSDEASGVGGAIYNAVSSPFTDRDFDPIGAYQTSRDAERIRLGEARDRSGWGGTAAEVLGGFASARPGTGLIDTAPGFVNRTIAGARTGAELGAASGFGHGNGLGGSVRGTVEGGVEGGAFGAALPAVGAAVRGVGRGTRGAWRLITGDNPDLARRTVGQGISDDINTPGSVAAQMQEAHANDVPMMLADTGDNTRGMLAATARAPGEARTLTRDALRQRQEGLPERVTSAIERDLGPASNPHQVADDLMAQARTAAAPLYEAAYARPGADAFAERIGNLIRRPAMQGAMQRAYRIAAEEGRDPNTSGFDINSSGEVTVNQTPSWQTLDYVKRGLDDVINAQPRNPATGQVILDEGTRAINNTRRAFLSAFDEANSDYAAARAAYAGPVQGRDAMDLGRRSLNMTADDLSARTNRMTPFEQEMFRLGHRRAMVEHVASAGDHADMVGRLIGTGKRRAAIQRLYGDNENFPRFVSTLQAEQAGHQTYRQAMLGSPTAPNIQDDAALPGATTAALTDLATTGGIPIATGIRQAVRLGTTRVGRNAQQQISTLLSENDPTRIGVFAQELQAHAARLREQEALAARRSGIYGVGIGSAAGRSIQDAYGQ